MCSAFLRLFCYFSSVFVISSKLEFTYSRFDIVLALDDSHYGVRVRAVEVFHMFPKIGPGDEETRFGVVYCGNPVDSNTVWLNKCTNTKCLENEINTSLYDKIPIYWKKCLVVVRNLFEPHKGDRPDAANVVLVLTDGLFGSDIDFTEEIKDLVAIKNVTMFSLLVYNGGDLDRVITPNLLKLANGNSKHMKLTFEGLLELLIITPGVGKIDFQDCVLGITELPCALINGSCTKALKPYIKVQPHKRGVQCPDPLPATNYTPCSMSDCSCLKPDFFAELECPKKNCNRNLHVNVSRIKPLFDDDECINVTYTWAICPYNCPEDQTEPTLIIVLVLVVSFVLMVLVLTVLGLLLCRRQKRIAERGCDSTTFTLAKTPSTSKVTTGDAVVPDDTEKSSGRSSRSKRKPKPIKRYYHPESEKSVAKKTSVNVSLKESKSVGSPSSKLSSVVAKSSKSHVTSHRKKPNGKKCSAIVPPQPSKIGSLKGKETATSKLKQSGSKSPQSNVSK